LLHRPRDGRGDEGAPLPPKFSEILGDFDIFQAVIREGCGWQPLYKMEIVKDREGQKFICGGLPQFCTDYGVQEGFFLLFSHRCGMYKFYIRIADNSFLLCYHAPRM
jgi:hypothetical protein